MADVDNLVLDQLRLIREDIRPLRTDMDAFKTEVHADLTEVKADIGGLRIMGFGLAPVVGQIDKRVEHLDERLGA